MNSVLGDEVHEKRLAEAVKIYGEGRWCEIARALKIQGTYITEPKNLYHDWAKINPDNKKADTKQVKDLVKLAIEARGVPRIFIHNWIKLYGKNYKLVPKLGETFQSQMFNYLRSLVKILSSKKRSLRARIAKIRRGAMTRFLSLGGMSSDDEFCKQVIESTTIISNILLAFNEYHNKSQPEQYEVCSKLVKKRVFDLALEHMLLIDTLTRINDKTISRDEQLIRQNSFVLPTIQEMKASAIYNLAFPVTQDSIFRGLYNDAVLQNPKDFVFDATEVRKVNSIPKKLQHVKPQRLLTVRGKIRNKDKFLYHSEHSERFTTDLLKNMNDDQESDVEIQKQLNQPQEIHEFVGVGDVQPSKDQFELELKENVQMRSYVEEQLENLKRYAYNRFKQK